MPKSVTPLESTLNLPKTPVRCAFINRQGNRCRTMLPADSASEFCASHSRYVEQRRQAESRKLAAELLQDCENIETFDGLLKTLSNLYRLVAQRRYSRMEAVSLAYIARTILRILTVTDAVEIDPEQGAVADPNSDLEPGCVDMLASWKAAIAARANAASPSGNSEQSAQHAAPPPTAAANPAPSQPADAPPAPVQPQPPQHFPEYGPRKAQTEFPINEHPWGPAARTAAIRRYTPKYRGF